MPHALFLGSFLATQDRVASDPPSRFVLPGGPHRRSLKSRIQALVGTVSRADRIAATKDYRTKYGDRENNSLPFIKQHLWHAIIDVITSLMFIAVPINSAYVF